MRAELASRAEKSLKTFVRCAWHVLEPATPFVPGWHLDAIAEHLEAVSRGEIRNLLINMPPRHAKSLTVSVFWPVWTWLTRPDTRWLFSSYALTLSIRDSLKCRRLIESPWFQARWRDRFALTSDQNAKMRFENDRSGYRIATSVGGSGTGEGGDVVAVDDPHNVTDKDSDAVREATLTWWDETMSTRLNDPKRGAKLIVMQRVGTDDLSGHVLKQGGYEHLNLPTEFEPDRRCTTSIGWTDPRKAEGELLWPARMGEAEIAEQKRRMTAVAYAGQFQQRPVPAGGNLFKLDWFGEFVDPEAVPPMVRVARGWDLAATDEGGDRDPDYTAGVKIGVDAHGTYYVLNVRRTRSGPLGTEQFVAETAKQLDGRDVRIRMEQEPGGSGKTVLHHYLNNVLRGFSARGFPSTGSKATRVAPFSAACERGAVKIVKGEWTNAYIDELTVFPRGSHDDQVDATAQAFTELAEASVVAFDPSDYAPVTVN